MFLRVWLERGCPMVILHTTFPQLFGNGAEELLGFGTFSAQFKELDKFS
jgi:hypothetical protein